DPDIALEHSRWEIGSVGKDRAEILLTHHGADHPARLQLFREDGGWKVGLVETFWSR
ncbi:MAG: putative cytosolic protein, partial [Deltaproteobacteria bacterium]|nr:putative cytosolic protein [Deltaproteobacteria bacterium]